MSKSPFHRLAEFATRVEAEEVARLGAGVFLSGNRTCELGMEHATDEPYESALIALERATRPTPERQK